MSHPTTSITCVTSGAAPVYVAAVFSPAGDVQTRLSFPTRSAAEAFLQAFMQEQAGEYGLVDDETAGAGTGAPPP